MMIVGGVVGIFAVAALLIGIRVYVNSVEEQNALFKCTTLIDCYQFLRDYPSSSYKEQLQEKLLASSVTVYIGQKSARESYLDKSERYYPER